MWNDLSLKNPVHDICEYGKKDNATLQALPELVGILTSSAEILTEEHPIWEEILIFKNIQAKYKRILHCDKCLQLLQRVSGCLKKMVLLNLSKIYLDLGEKILLELQRSNSSSYFIPSQQQLEYVLIRTQSAAKLICEALHYSRETFCYLVQKLKVGHLVINLMMATSVTARLNLAFKGFLIQLYDIYKKVYPWRKRLRKGGWSWSKPLELPENLETWINLEESEHMKPKRLPKEQLDFLSSIFDENDYSNVSSLVDEDVILLDNLEPVENNEINEVSDCVSVEDLTIDSDFDIGVPIARSEIESNDNSFNNSLSDSPSPKRAKKNNKETTNALNVSSTPSPRKERKSNPKLSNVLPSALSSSQRKRKNNQNIAIEHPSTSTLQEKDNQNLTKDQKKLLKKIREAKDMKTLKIIFNNLDITNNDLLPKGLTAEKIRLIDKVFLRLKRGISDVNKSGLLDSEKEAEAKFLVKVASLKLAKHLNILPKKNEVSPEKASSNKLKPVRTFKELNELYETIYQRLQIAQEYKMCAKLKKCFKCRSADIKLLEENGEKDTANKLIYSSSKFFLAKFLN